MQFKKMPKFCFEIEFFTLFIDYKIPKIMLHNLNSQINVHLRFVHWDTFETNQEDKTLCFNPLIITIITYFSLDLNLLV